MACKLIIGKDFRGFQCSRVGMFDYLNDGIFDPDKKPLDPYSRFECDHSNNYEYKGYLKCSVCSMVYNENSLSWIDALKEFE